VKMDNLLDEAETAGVIDHLIRKCARKVADEADDVLHERLLTLSQAYDVLVRLRSVLQHVYAVYAVYAED